MNSSPNQKIQNMSRTYIIWSTKCIFEKISKLFLSSRKIRVVQFFDQKVYLDLGLFVTKWNFWEEIKKF